MKETFHADHDGTWYLKKEQDVSPFLEEAHRARTDHSRYKSEAFNKKASIPVVVAKDWCKRHGIKYGELLNNTDVLKRFLNDPDNKAFLHIPGKI